jgi:hypothetical protein
MLKRVSASVLFLGVAVLLCHLAHSKQRQYWVERLSPHEKAILEALNKERISKKLPSLQLNGELSEAMGQELAKFTEAEQDSPSVGDRIRELFSGLQQDVYVLTDTTTEEAVGRLKSAGALSDQVLCRENRSVIIATREADGVPSHTCIYFSKYVLDFMLTDELQILPGSDTGQLVSQEIKGQSNAKFLRLLCYQGTRLPFFLGNQEVFEEELSLPEDGRFSVSIPVERFGKEAWRVAVFVRNKSSEKYELVTFLKRGD